MANRAVVVDLLVRTNQFTSGMRTASRTMASETTNMETKTKSLQMQIGLLGVGMVAFAATAVKKWADFDAAMTRTEAVSEGAAAQIGKLNDAAKSDEVITLGYNALDASDSIYELTKAGISATDIIGGSLTGALSLAAVEAMDAGDAAAILSSALTQFGLHGPDAAHVADLLAAGAAKAQGSAHDLGLALKQSGLVADQFGLSIEQTTGTLAFFANAGLIGSDAGTSLRTMLLHLAGPSTKAAKLMDTIGLSVYGANGKMVDMVTLANNLQTSMGKLTEEQRNQALATIFGADATRAASLLYREGGDKVQEWTDKVNDAGYATRAAAKMMDNLNGDVKKMGATWDRTMINMGESADAPLRKLVTGITSLIDWFGDLNPAIQGVILALTGGGGLVILATLGIAQIVSALTTLQAGLVATGVISQATATKMATAFGVATRALGLLGLAAGVAYGAFQIFQGMANATKLSVDSLADSYDVAAGKFTDSARALAATKITESFPWWKEMQTGYDSLGDAAKALKIPLDDLAKAMTGDDVASKRITAITDALALSDKEFAKGGPKVKAFNDLIADLGIKGTKGHDAAVLLNEALGVNGEVTDKAITKAQDMAVAQGQVADAAGEGAAGIDGMTESTEAITAAEVEAQKAHDDYVSSIVESFTGFFGLGDVYQGVIDKQKDLAESAAKESKSTKDSWEDFYDGTSVSADDYIAELQRQVEAQEAWAQNLIDLTNRAKTELPANMQAAALEMISELRNLGPEGAAQIELLKNMSAPQLQQVVELFNRQGIAAGQDWATGVDEAETPEVDIDTTPVDAKMDTLQKKIDDAAGKHITIPFDANIQPAMTKLATLNAALDAAAGKHVTIPYQGNIQGGHADGGAISGPGTGTSDSINARLSDGEHVLTASDVQKAGGQDAIYRMRAGIQSGLMKFAGGGAVNLNGRSLDYWKSAQIDQGDIIRLQIQIRDLQADLGKKGKTALKGLDRQQSQWDLDEARRKLAEGQYANSINVDALIAAEDARQEAAEAAQKNAEALADKRSNYGTDIRRGDFANGASGSKSGAYGAIDSIRDNVLPLLSGGQANALATALNKAEASASGLFDQMDAVDEALKSATDNAKDLQSMSDSVQSSLAGGFSLGNVGQTGAVNPFTGEITGGSGGAGKGMLASAQAYAAKTRMFAGKLKALADKGFAGVILQEVAGMGVEAGIPAADALLGLDLGDTNALNAAYADIANFGGAAGQAVTEGFYAGGLAAADGLVAGIQANKDQVQAAIMDMALAMQNALKSALGIASPSRKFRAMMQFVGQGVVLGLEDQQGVVADASARMFSGVTVPGGRGAYGGSGSGYGSSGDLTASLSDEQVERLAVAFETGNVRNINASTAQKNRNMQLTYGARGR